MIDEKILEKWEETMRPAVTATFEVENARELIRLAKLGLWAERHGIPAMTESIREAGKYASEEPLLKALACFDSKGKMKVPK